MLKAKSKIISTIMVLSLLFSATMLLFPTSSASADVVVTASTSTSAQSGIAGSVLTYSITLSNSGSDPVNVDLKAVSAGGWDTPTVLPPNLDLAAGGTANVTVNVPIDSAAVAGQNDITTLYVYQGGSTTDVLATLQVTTTVKNATSPTPTPAYSRPLLAVNSYSYGTKAVKAGQEFELLVNLGNRGQLSALNVVVTFEGTGFYPRSTGGVQTVGNIEPGGSCNFYQTFLVSDELAWQNTGTIKVTATYADPAGTSHSDVFNLTIGIVTPATYAATSTPTASSKPQLVITNTSTDVDPLQPGSIFKLTLDVKNMGNSDAKSVTMVLGGGVTTNDSGTPQPGGVSGSSGDLANFAPLGSSNIVVVGDVKQGESAKVEQVLVTNVTTQPGAYTLKISFVYTDSKNTRIVDDQVITLLVYSLPQVEINFYRDPGQFMVGMPSTLPLQVTNLGKKSSVLGNMKVNCASASIMNNVSLVGALESGGYYTLDSEITPMQEGPMEIEISINYTDDFNQTRYITQTIPIEVMPAPEIEPTMEGQTDGDMIVEPMAETFWSKVGRFFKGLFGLDSGVQEPAVPGGESLPTEEFQPVVVPKG